MPRVNITTNRYSLKLILSHYEKDNKTRQVILRLTINRKTRMYGLNVYVPESKWDAVNGRITYPGSIHASTDSYIRTMRAKAESILVSISSSDESLTFDAFDRLMFGKDDQLDFYAFCDTEIERLASRTSPGYIKKVKGDLNKIRRFKPSLNADEINYKFLSDLDFHLRSTLNNKHNTAAKTLSTLRVFVSLAIRLDLIKDNPFKTFRLPMKPVKREYLSQDELSTLVDLHRKNDILLPKLHHVLQYFLFACHTGLRYEDVKQLEWQNVVDKQYLSVVQHKTEEQVMIPLSQTALTLLPESTGNPHAKIFRVLSNQKTNDYLKVIALQAGLPKSISFHTARHTFATVSLNLGIPLPVVQKILGHNSIRTTELYAKLMDKTKFEEMKKWDQ